MVCYPTFDQQICCDLRFDRSIQICLSGCVGVHCISLYTGRPTLVEAQHLGCWSSRPAPWCREMRVDFSNCYYVEECPHGAGMEESAVGSDDVKLELSDWRDVVGWTPGRSA